MPDEHRSAAAFDMMTFPLSGRRLIEASAGTGKTFSIAHLYLRLVLGVGAGAGQPLAVEQILVVTFTRAAASELRARIRTLLDSAYRDLRSGRSENAFIRALIEDDALDPDVLIRRLRDALLAMDEAAISTIHAFAVKAASTFVFETGAIDGVELSDTGDERGKRVLTDLYRRLCIDETGQGAIGELLGTPRLEEFRRYWGRHLPPDLACRPGVDGDPDQAFSALLARRQALQDEHEALAKAWRAMYPLEDPDTHVAGIRDRLVQDLEGNPTSALKPGQVNRLVEYFEALLFAPALGLVDRTGTVYFDTARKVLASTDSPASVRLMLRVRDHVQAIVDAREGLVREARAVVLKTLQAARADIDLKRMSLDEVISLVNRRLDRDDTRKPLRQAITGTWPVCLVDEFQDTDPEQFRMFNRIYGNDDSEVGTGLFMIGDPKQSIYAFRGADIFAYLNVRREVVGAADADQGLYTLDRNWRSKQALVSATNALFAEARPEDRTFVFDGIPFEPVVSSETTGDLALPTYRVGDDCPVSDHSLVFIGNPDDPADNDALRKDALIARYARDTARRIAALLDRNHGARVGDAPLRPGDIAVLVRSAREARAVRRALARPEVGLRSVYASQRDSVFADAEVAEDLLHVLVAMDQCTDKRRLRTALATPLMRGFDYDFAEVDRIDDDDEALERVIAEFGAYRDAWRAYGVLAALGRLFDDPRRNLLGRAAARPDSDRLLTDLRHLGDLLQQRDQDCDAPEQLIDWFAAQIDDDSAVDEDAKRIRLESDEDLVRVATIFVAKGLEYPVVFLPFFFLPGQVDLGRQLPMYRERSGAAWTPVVDFEGDASEIRAAMNRENLAEDMRLLYVGITRAIYQCHVGISASLHHGRGMFGESVWGRLLSMTGGDDGEPPDRPAWPRIRAALESRLADVADNVGFASAGDVTPARYRPPMAARPKLLAACPTTSGPDSHWRVTSYSGLARGDTPAPGFRNDDEAAVAPGDAGVDRELDESWTGDIRYTLPGSAQTGSCLHDILEHHALTCSADGRGDDLETLVRRQLARYAIEAPDGPDGVAGPVRVAQWLAASLDQPLTLATGVPGGGAATAGPTLTEIFARGNAIPEMRFDFAIGRSRPARFDTINAALVAAGLAPVERFGQISGLMTGAIDLVFQYERSFFVVDYKSNTLGRAPGFYDQAGMSAAIRDHRYDLQYMIYTVAAHRHFRRRLGDLYGFDDGEFRFGGVLYLFLRGMGLDEHPGHGAWRHRPGAGDVERLDRALSGDDDGHD